MVENVIKKYFLLNIRIFQTGSEKNWMRNTGKKVPSKYELTQ